MKSISFRARALFVLATALTTWSVSASDYPIKPVSIIDAFAPGGSTDFLSRLVAKQTTLDWGKSIVVENRPGAAGQIGMGAVVRAEPDGYTLLTLPNEIRSVIPLLYKLPYDVEQSLVPVASLARVPMIMTVHPSVPANTVQEFIAYAKANPDKIAYGSAGDGTLHHLSGELFKMKANVDMMHVPYKGTAPAVNDLLSGRVQVVFSPISAVLQHIKAGKLRALGVASSKPVVALPGLKTLDESGLPNYASDLWVTLFAPAGTPQPVLDKWIAQLKKVANLDETRAALAVQGIEPDFDTSESLKQRFVQDTERWREVVKAANIKLN